MVASREGKVASGQGPVSSEEKGEGERGGARKSQEAPEIEVAMDGVDGRFRRADQVPGVLSRFRQLCRILTMEGSCGRSLAIHRERLVGRRRPADGRRGARFTLVDAGEAVGGGLLIVRVVMIRRKRAKWQREWGDRSSGRGNWPGEKATNEANPNRLLMARRQGVNIDAFGYTSVKRSQFHLKRSRDIRWRAAAGATVRPDSKHEPALPADQGSTVRFFPSCVASDCLYLAWRNVVLCRLPLDGPPGRRRNRMAIRGATPAPRDHRAHPSRQPKDQRNAMVVFAMVPAQAGRDT